MNRPNINKKRLIELAPDAFSRILVTLSPITSIVLFNVQGTTPVFLMTILVIFIPIYGWKKYVKISSYIIVFFIVYLCFLQFSQFANAISPAKMVNLIEIRRTYIFGQIRTTNITQGIYFLLAIYFMLYVNVYFKEKMIGWMFSGIIFLAIYGIYEFIFFAIFQRSGDFLSNRIFGEISNASQSSGFLNGSQLQISNVLGRGFMRLKSLTAEPSMYALTSVPFLLYAYEKAWNKTALLLLFGIILSQSTTAIIGVAVGISYLNYSKSIYTIIIVPITALFVLVFYLTSESVRMGLDSLIFQKLNSFSGSDRIETFVYHANVIFDGNFVRFLFGLGFGTVRSLDMFSNLLANVGVIGFLAYTALIVGPVFLMPHCPDRRAIVAALLSIWVMEMATVSEYSYLPPWFFVALGYVRCRRLKTMARPSRGHAAPVPITSVIHANT